MLEQPIELSPDLEWMLLSGQADEVPLAEGLVREYYPRLYQLNVALFDSSKAAERVALETLAMAILRSHNFSGREGLNAWIFSIALASIRKEKNIKKNGRKTDRGWGEGEPIPFYGGPCSREKDEQGSWFEFGKLDLLDRSILLMRTLSELKKSDLAAVFGRPEPVINQRLSRIFAELEMSRHGGESPSKGYSAETGINLISQSLQKRWPRPDLSEKEIARLHKRVAALLKEKRRRGWRLSRLKELLVVTLIITLVVGGVSTANQVFSDTRYFIGNEATATAYHKLFQESVYGGGGYQSSAGAFLIRPISTPVTPVVPLAPLTLHSDSEAIRKRIEMSSHLWHTIWEEGQVNFYGPVGYRGPPIVRQYQQWVSKDVAGMVLSGPVDGQPDKLTTLFNTLSDVDKHDDDELQERVGLEFQWLALAGQYRDIAEITATNAVLNRLNPMNDFIVVKREWLAKREVLVVDQINPTGVREARLWIDTITGKLLREQHFKGVQHQVLLREAVITRIYFDVDFPDDLFLGWERVRRYPVLETSGQPALPLSFRGQERLNVPDIRPVAVKIDAPERYDPAHSRLVFQWKGYFKADGVHAGETELYADGYYLGEVDIAHPMGILDCQRSADGMLIVFLETASGKRVTEPVRWFYLNRLNEVHTSLSVSVVRSFSIAPDSRRLAVFGMGTPIPREFRSTRGIFILDTVTGERLGAVEADLDVLIGWSPDGGYVGGIKYLGTREDKSQPLSLLAYNTETGEMVEGVALSRGFSMEAGQVIEYEFNDLDWRGEINLRVAGLEGCIIP